MADTTIDAVTTSERDARRAKSEQRTAELSAANAALITAENDLKACDDSIDTHQAALIIHKRALESSRDERKGLVAARKHARSQLSAATALAAKAEAKYDKAVLAQLVHDAKHTPAPKKTPPTKRPTTRRAPAAKSTATETNPVKSATTPAKTTTPRTPRAR